MKIKQYMSKDVVTVSPETSVTEAVAKMESHQIHNLPVTKNGQFVGLITQDIIDAKSASDASVKSFERL